MEGRREGRGSERGVEEEWVREVWGKMEKWVMIKDKTEIKEII